MAAAVIVDLTVGQAVVGTTSVGDFRYEDLDLDMNSREPLRGVLFLDLHKDSVVDLLVI